jgi:hypothetical protein
VTALRQALTSPEFLTGLRFGAAGAMVVGIGCWWWQSKRGRAGSVVGLLLAGAAVVAMPVVRSVPRELILGLAMLGVAGSAASQFSWPILVKALVAMPGAWLVLEAIPDVYTGWLRWLMAAATVVGGPLTDLTDQRFPKPALGPLLLAATVAGTFLAVPDTEVLLVVLGVMTPLAWMGWPLDLSRVGAGGSYMAVGLLVWAGAWGGVGRPASTVGMVACLGVLVLLPIVAKPDLAADVNKHLWALFAIHLLVVGVGSRVAGLQTDPLFAATIATAALVVGGFLLILVRRNASKLRQESPGP